MLTIDGSQGEGGGQILRTALALSLVTATPFRITRIRAGRKKPGLLRQHLTAVQAAARVGQAEVRGAALGALELTFVPGSIQPGEYHFAVGTAGSTTLVLQAVLPALLRAPGPTTLTLEGGTHNPFAPPFEFLTRTFLPVLARLGPRVTATLVRPGFFPAGGGELRVVVEPVAELRPLRLVERGAVRRISATALVSQLPRQIGERELRVVRERLGLTAEDVELVEVTEPRGPGNVLSLAVACDEITEVFTAFGERGVSAEQVAANAVAEAEAWRAAEVPVGEHLADQLLLPCALAGGGEFRTVMPSSHTRTNIDVVWRFLDVDVAVQEDAAGGWRITVGPPSA